MPRNHQSNVPPLVSPVRHTSITSAASATRHHVTCVSINLILSHLLGIIVRVFSVRPFFGATITLPFISIRATVARCG
ncbi:hypothetical protein E2C01_074263 [Portunus trituberculatus]|uniref:Uncharacterized protein n=1 Tax=Portunus trituberculatus TaxID=210409 RepID=A0A5B7I2Y1_PORTR|nr:hypothetical protein [Portunus trituberculatus]